MTDAGSMPASPAARLAAALQRFDEENARDPNPETAAGRTWPRELLYAQRLTDWVLRLCPAASEPLRLAARGQHLCRWMIPRDQFPRTRAGYLKWRAELKQFHARKARAILEQVGYPEAIIAQVEALILKQNFPHDADSRILEDALCLVFLEHQLADLARRSEDAKMVNALRKSWHKMTPAAREIALQLPLGAPERALLDQALASPG